MEPLTDLERRILAFAAKDYRQPGARHLGIAAEFDMPAVRFDQLLNVLIDKPAALVADPVLVNRLRRVRQARRNGRTRAA